MFVILFKMSGSCIPKASVAAATSVTICIIIKIMDHWYGESVQQYIELFLHPLGCQTYTMLLGYVIVFQTNMTISRYWDGCTDIMVMLTKWTDSFSLISSFLKASHVKAPHNILHVLAHWYTLMAALAIVRLRSAELENSIPPVRPLKHFRPVKGDNPLDFAGKELEDEEEWFVGVLRPLSTDEVDQLNESTNKVRLVSCWILNAIETFRSKKWLKCPDPILTRAYQELSNGLMGFDQAAKLCTIPFPFPMMQLISIMLVVDTVILPFVIAQFTKDVIWSIVLTFIVVLGYWGLYFICLELENPYGEDLNDLSLVEMQREYCAVITQIYANHVPLIYMKMLGIQDPIDPLQEENMRRRVQFVDTSQKYQPTDYRLGGVVHEATCGSGKAVYSWM